MSDIIHVNAGHFINSADAEENSHMHGQLTAGVSTELDWDQWQAANGDSVKWGSRSVIFLGGNGALHSVQAGANSAVREMMQDKKELMLALGAKLIEKRTVAETATAARIDASGENSVLGDIVNNIEEAYRQCIVWVGEFMGVDVNPEEALSMNRSFFDDSVSPQEVIAAIQLYDRSLIADKDVQKLAKRVAILDKDRDIDEMRDDIKSENPNK